MLRGLATASAVLMVALAARAEHYRFRFFGSDDGMTTAVTRILQDRQGFLWAGTTNGLYRYDGGHFQRFGVGEGLPSAAIRYLVESADGTLWVLTATGLARRVGDVFQTVKTGLASDVREWEGLDAGPDGTVYLGYERGLLAGVPPLDGAPPRFHPPPGVPEVRVTAVYADPGGGVWFGCAGELCFWNHGGLRKYGAADGLPRARWGAILRDQHGDLWVRSPQRMYVLPAGAAAFQPRGDGLPQCSNAAVTINMDHDGVLLVSSDHGLARWLDGRWQLTGVAEGLESESVTSGIEDREGSLWIGTWGAGLARWPGNGEWAGFTAAEGLVNNIVWAVRRHPSGALWVGTDRGLVRLEDGAVKVWTKKDGLGGDKVKSLAVAPDGALWVGSFPGGVSRIDMVSGRIQVFGLRAGLGDDGVVAIHFDAYGRLWASAGDGLYRADAHNHFERILPPGAGDHTMFFRMINDRLGRLWVGSSSGLYCWDGKLWRRFTRQDGLRADSVTHVGEGGDGAVWVAYREPLGISRLAVDGPRLQVRHYTKAQGLPSDAVYFLGMDAAHRLWVGTDAGAAVQSGGGWRSYNHEDGMVWDDCAAAAFWAEPDGTVWMGTLKGLARFRPRSRPVQPPPPPAVILGVRFGDRAANPSRPAVVPFRDRDFLVSYSGLTFLSETQVRFRYRLIGLDPRWVETTQREVRFSTLPAGAYTFEVMACNRAGQWSPAPARVWFRIVPPWWQTWWFGGLAAVFVVALVAVLLRARMLQMLREQRRLEAAVLDRTSELEQQKAVVERQNQEIEKLFRQAQLASRHKSEFLANMSHEIRTPMNGVLGMAQLALETSLDEQQRDCIATIQDSARALLVIINDILDFSKIEAGKMELAHEPFRLRKWLQDAMQLMAWKARERGLTMTWKVDDAVPEVLAGDAGRLRQVLLNLVGNAVKFTPHGEIAVSVELAESAPPPAPAAALHSLRFAVRDSGIGIAPDEQEFIFEAFAQADSSSLRRQAGTGLGLAICSKLVRLMNGRIWVESRLGEGSTFFFTALLDAARDLPDDTVLPAADAPPATPVSLRVLVADDNAVNRKLVCLALARMGHQVVAVTDGRAAVETASAGGFDVILMDIQMPEMDGYQAAAIIRAAEHRCRAGRVPIVALTAHAMTGDRELCLAAGMDDYLAKPIDLGALRNLLARLASRRTACLSLPS